MSKLLAGTHYDPAGAASISTAALNALTAIDIANLRLPFYAPANGVVRVRLRAVTSGASSSASILLGVLEGATVRGRQVPVTGRINSGANAMLLNHCDFLVYNLNPGQLYTWDAAYSTQFAVASTAIKYGGPNTSTANDAFGSIQFEIHDTPGLLVGVHYDPSLLATKSAAAAAAMSAFDTTNLRLPVPVPQSGACIARIRAIAAGATALSGTAILGILQGATVIGRSRGLGQQAFMDAGALATQFLSIETTHLVQNLVAGQTLQWDAAVDIEAGFTGASFGWGGPNDGTQMTAYGGFAFDVWDAVPADVQPIIRRRRRY